MTTVRATARLQLHAEFPFAAAAERVPYYARLGVSHLYLSPILTARAGSRHGYDVVDPRAVSAELGGEDGLRALAQQARAHGLGLVADIVPNHMAVGAENPWWMAVLEHGRRSRHARFFDIDWDSADPVLRGRVLAPFLGRPYGEALEAAEIALAHEPAADRYEVRYFGHRFPLTPRDQAALRAAGPAAALRAHDATHGAGRARLHALLERQHYRLAWWHTAHDEINWRRFFDLADYAGLRVEDRPVFEAVHATTFRLYAEGLIDGVRVDHVDGLADPRAYCRALRARLAALVRRRPPEHREPPWIVIEKILAPGERLPADWRVDGTTGYAFMNDANALLHDPRGEAPLTALWTSLSGRSGEFAVEERRARRRIADELLIADVHATALALHRIARSDLRTRDATLPALRRVLLELLVHFPVYRVYVTRHGRAPADEAVMAQVREAARASCRPADRPLVDLVDRWLGGEAPAAVPAGRARALRLRAVTRFQQLSSPLAAKAVEDTAFYRHARLLSRNEVGADPGQFATCPDAFHAEARRRRGHFPRALLATATHDHKRGEDARARLAVLSEIAGRWGEEVQAWLALNAARRRAVDGAPAPAPDDEYMLYQTLVGHWPPDLRRGDAAALRAFGGRVAQWYRKAIREAKLRSSWVEPHAAYEAACAGFLEALLDPAGAAEVLGRIEGFVDTIAAAGAANGLAQTLLRLTAPGIPDLYQGTEFWDFSLVDPDNRRPVDYAGRAAGLAADTDCAALARTWRDGRVKQALIAHALALRAEHPDLFVTGAYEPLAVTGPAAERLVAYARRRGDAVVIALASRWNAGVIDRAALHIAPRHWHGTALRLPPPLRARYRSVLDGRIVEARDELVPVADVTGGFPVALLHAAGSPPSHDPLRP